MVARQGGQWVEIDAPSSRKLLAFVFRPRGRGPFPLVVVLHGGGGFAVGWTSELARAFQSAGYISVAGCWFRGQNPNDGVSPSRVECPDGPRFADLEGREFYANALPYADALVAGAQRLPGVKADRTGLWGLSRGGAAVLMIGSLGVRVQAIVADSAYYGPQREVGTSPIDSVGKQRAPLLMLHGTADALCPIATARAYEGALRAAGLPVESTYYEGAPHTIYGNPPTEYPNRNDALARGLAFFRKHLDAP
jgi:dipeptidyl aminopeptidase/acylaminoacyl peptidase